MIPYKWCSLCGVRATRSWNDRACELCFAAILNDLDGGRT